MKLSKHLEYRLHADDIPTSMQQQLSCENNLVRGNFSKLPHTNFDFLLLVEASPHITVEIRVLIREASMLFSLSAPLCGLGYSHFTQIAKKKINIISFTHLVASGHTDTFCFCLACETYAEGLFMLWKVVPIKIKVYYLCCIVIC